jgi:hypothetical protein
MTNIWAGDRQVSGRANPKLRIKKLKPQTEIPKRVPNARLLSYRLSLGGGALAIVGIAPGLMAFAPLAAMLVWAGIACIVAGAITGLASSLSAKPA